jgi:orotidine-5'-phosphate decarboxylase
MNDALLKDPKEYIVLALDYDNLDEAIYTSTLVGEFVGTLKVGLELFCACGPKAVKSVKELGFKVFLDLKLCDIPVTVAKTLKVISKMGVDFTTIHLQPEPATLKFIASDLKSLKQDLCILGVTVLTSQNTNPEKIKELINWALELDLGGVVLSAADLNYVKDITKQFEIVCPGIRTELLHSDDQVRIASPEKAVKSGATKIVVGRPITKSSNPKASAKLIYNEVKQALKK